jgi:hypothetical protein
MLVTRLKISLTLILLALASGISSANPALASAELQNPPPSSGVESKPVQQNAAASKSPTSQDQRGTEKMPLIIKSLPTEDTPEQAEQNRKEREAKAASDWWLKTYTGLLALFTFGLIIVGSVQIGVFYLQLKLIRQSLTDAKVAADAATTSSQAALETANSICLAERAYVKMSHLPPGLEPVADSLSMTFI